MAKKGSAGKKTTSGYSEDLAAMETALTQRAAAARRPSALLDTRVIYCGDNLEQLKKLPEHCVDLIYTDPPFNSNSDITCKQPSGFEADRRRWVSLSITIRRITLR